MKRMMIALLICAIVLVFAGCAKFTVNDPVTGNNLIDTSGGALVSRNDNFECERTWLDDNNNLTTFKVKRVTDERADAQLEAIKIMAETIRAASPTTPIP